MTTMEHEVVESSPETESQADEALQNLEDRIEKVRTNLKHLEDRRARMIAKQQQVRYEGLRQEIDNHISKASSAHMTVSSCLKDDAIHFLEKDIEGDIDAVLVQTREFMHTQAFITFQARLAESNLCLIVDNHAEYDAMVCRVPLASCIGCMYECTIFTSGKENGGGPICCADIELDPANNGGGILAPRSDYCPFGGKGKWLPWSLSNTGTSKECEKS